MKITCIYRERVTIPKHSHRFQFWQLLKQCYRINHFFFLIAIRSIKISTLFIRAPVSFVCIFSDATLQTWLRISFLDLYEFDYALDYWYCCWNLQWRFSALSSAQQIGFAAKFSIVHASICLCVSVILSSWSLDSHQIFMNIVAWLIYGVFDFYANQSVNIAEPVWINWWLNCHNAIFRWEFFPILHWFINASIQISFCCLVEWMNEWVVMLCM